MKFTIIKDRWSSASARRMELKADHNYTLLMTRYGPHPSGIYPVLQPITIEIGGEEGGNIDMRQINDPQEEDHLILVDDRCRTYKLDVDADNGTVALQLAEIKVADAEDITENQLIDIMDEEE
jgi:hypothetical protein